MAEAGRIAELRAALEGPDDPAQAARLWRAIGKARSARRARRRLAGACAGAMVVGLSLGLLGAHLHARAAARGARPAEDAGPLRLATGDPLPQRLEGARGGAAVDLSDGSTLTFAPEAGLEVLGNGSREVVLSLRRGRVGFAVRPGGPRRWTIDCGLATVEIVGTRFELSRSDEALRVAVSAGAVSVRGEAVPGGERRLGPGQTLVIRAGRRVPAPSAVPPAGPAAEPPSDEEAPRAAPPSAPEWRRAAAARDYGHAYELLQPSGLASASRQARSVDDLLALADVARNSGHPEEAVLPLELVMDEHPRDPRAPLSAFTLGRLCLDRLDRPRRAARAFDRAVELGLPRALVEDAMHLEVVARLRAGDVEGARRAARDYLARFPEGPHAREVLEAVARREAAE